MRIDHNRVQLEFLKAGAPQIEEWYREGAISEHTVKRAHKELEETNPERAADFEVMLRRLKVITPRRGPTRPVVGDERPYKVQNVDGTPFLRVPVELLDVLKGGEVLVRFCPNGKRQIVLEPMAEAEAESAA